MLSAQSEFVQLVKTRTREKRISFGDALMQIARERPSLYSDYHKEVLNSDPVIVTQPSEPARMLSDARTEFVEAIKADMRERGVTFGEAMMSVARARPKLARDYREKVLAGK